ncbi:MULTISPECIES: diadenylate cyclase CdaA [Caloramator]|uniref:Diadenylate cyclase n=1 Tax=Caloramator proteoclasticus DSM 10124 TaxID=1121262 RepID=A0A1M4XQ75_9CLOT|nr:MULTISPECIES: diadenylate cyclase CdaA [Caloramator]SHE95382.1 diadenylate cyclase [Caloramator proteoclasticus DSM 10124]
MFDLNSMISIIKHVTILNVIDILIVAYIFYKLFTLIRKTRAEQLVKGLVFILLVMKASEILGFITLHWLIQNTLTVGLIALIIIFQPELRKALEHLGRSKILNRRLFDSDEEVEKVVNEIVIAADNMSKNKTGALIVIEQDTGLNDYVESGTVIDGVVSSQLLENIFVENTPLHDGAVIIRKDRIVAASCVLPLTEQFVSKELGTRHRAAIGITETCDAIAVVVSEETGIISISINGKLVRGYNAERLKKVLYGVLKKNIEIDTTLFKRVKIWLSKINSK